MEDFKTYICILFVSELFTELLSDERPLLTT